MFPSVMVALALLSTVAVGLHALSLRFPNSSTEPDLYEAVRVHPVIAPVRWCGDREVV